MLLTYIGWALLVLMFLSIPLSIVQASTRDYRDESLFVSFAPTVIATLAWIAFQLLLHALGAPAI
ncbi:hypothetical protein [Rhodococcus sp. Q]|uniref:hypothetical protein n=1 Tax=Rhodococcus sp. Q TaxID=2502252 RepID=UPI0010F9AC08|nr:hypothetical protein [Rhodococcus sp. Q]